MVRIFLIGIDGADWKLIRKWCRDGELTTFKKLMETGAFGVLKSTIPPLSPCAWNSIFTGVSPAKHEVYGFLKQKQNSYFYRIGSARDRKTDAIWGSLSKSGKRSILVNIPFAYPPDKINGIMITGLGTPSKDSNFVHPAQLREKILSLFPNYDVDFNEEILARSFVKLEEFEDKICQIEQSQYKLAKFFLEHEKWDFFAVVFRSLDVIQHYAFDDKKKVLSYYKKFDNWLGDILRSVVDEDIILFVCSDHGFKSVQRRFYVNNWLEEIGLFKISSDKSLPLRIGIDAEKIRGWLIKSGFRNFVEKIQRNKHIERLLRIFPSSSHEYINKADWLETRAFFYRASSGLIKINLEGREPLGKVSLNEAGKIKNYLREMALALKDHETGKNPIRQVFFKEELYRNPNEETPEVILLGGTGYELMDYNNNHRLFEWVRSRPGDHDVDGVFFAFGPDIKAGKHIEEISLYDIAPTILSLLDVPIPSGVDGSILMEIFQDGFDDATMTPETT